MFRRQFVTGIPTKNSQRCRQNSKKKREGGRQGQSNCGHRQLVLKCQILSSNMHLFYDRPCILNNWHSRHQKLLLAKANKQWRTQKLLLGRVFGKKQNKNLRKLLHYLFYPNISLLWALFSTNPLINKNKCILIKKNLQIIHFQLIFLNTLLQNKI